MFLRIDRVRFRPDVWLFGGVVAMFFMPRSCPFPSRRVAFMIAYKRRFSCLDRVRFRHDLSFLRRISDDFLSLNRVRFRHDVSRF